MTARTVELEELKQRQLEDVLHEVVEHEEIFTVQLPDGEGVTIQPCPRLEPLPKLKCIVPRDWKDAIHGPGD